MRENVLVLWFCARVHFVWLHSRVRAARFCARASVLAGSWRGLAGYLIQCSYAGFLVLARVQVVLVLGFDVVCFCLCCKNLLPLLLFVHV